MLSRADSIKLIEKAKALREDTFKLSDTLIKEQQRARTAEDAVKIIEEMGEKLGYMLALLRP